ncbi:penicillin-binding transpeptidase domain-containing protein [Planococcus sp. FY231025]|uniref:penicillin-binding transpeptidase domain-containing protein n=1 Tax=Planococcus sp. FY231025 TaxID=3455699 RepID=UPI003F8FC764
MKKSWIAIAAVLVVVLLAGCQQQATPEDRIKEYISHWNKGEFAEMYENYLNDGTKGAYDAAQFVDRQKKIQEDLNIENLEVTYTEPPEDAEWNEEEPADFPVQVKMDTAAGPVEFEQNMTLLHEAHGEEENWFVEWNPSFIFPQLEAEDKIQIERVQAARGEILDRNGLALAINGGGFNIGIVPEKFTDESKKAELAKLLEITVESIDQQLGQSWVKPELFVPIAKLARTDTETIDAAIKIPGVAAQNTPMREYPYGAALSHVTGYIGSITAEQLEERKDQGYTANDQIGRGGMEGVLEERLRGTDGLKIWIDKPAEGIEPITVAEKPVENGETIQLTIDAELQKKTYDAMKGEPGTSAALNPKTGETLALVSSPGFDPNEFMLGISGTRYKELEEDPKNPLFNRFRAAYAPGSTLKPVTAAIGMEAGTLKPAEGITINGKTWQKDASWGDYKVSRLHPEAPNPVDLNIALVYSDNIYFAQQALNMGNETFVAGLKEFGFGEEIEFPLSLKASQISNEGTIGSAGQLADTSFGQGQMLTNILHLVSMYEPFLTDGVMYKPTLLLDEADSQVWKEGLVSAETAATLRTTMRNVVVDGYAQSANIPEADLAGKTGTAELKAAGEDRGKENGFFVTYDASNPDVLMAMMIENVEDNGGSDYVAGMAAQAFK